MENYLEAQVINSLQTYDDFINAYIQIDQTANNVSWVKADLLSAMDLKLGDQSLRELSKELGENYSTLVSYIRVSRAFPIESRSENRSFSAHFQASMIDSFDGKSFSGEKRFLILQKAEDENFSTRRIAEEVQKEKNINSVPSPAFNCQMCDKKQDEVVEYYIGRKWRHGYERKFNLHPSCFKKLMDIINAKIG